MDVMRIKLGTTNKSQQLCVVLDLKDSVYVEEKVTVEKAGAETAATVAIAIPEHFFSTGSTGRAKKIPKKYLKLVIKVRGVIYNGQSPYRRVIKLSKGIQNTLGSGSLPFLVFPGKPTLTKIKILQFSRSLKKLDENNTNNIISRDGLNNVATLVSTTVISAFFASLERCACVYLTTFEPDDDEEESKDRPRSLCYQPPLRRRHR
ncbi:hypothetical protein QYF36_003656 [Acer negundo]|nr:hypothetical protein QYF36_003656 [Acer negundo]